MRTYRGEVTTVTVLAIVIAGLFALYVPNHISTFLGLGNKQNKVVQTDKTTLILDKEGVPVAYRNITSSKDEQQKISFLEWLLSLPVAVLVLMFLGVIFPPVSILLARLRGVWKSAFKNQYHGLRDLPDISVTCRKCGDTVTIDTKEHVFSAIQRKMDNRDQVLQERVRTELVK